MKKVLALTLSLIFFCSSIICSVAAENSTDYNQPEITNVFSVTEMNFDTNTETIKEFKNMDTQIFDDIETQNLFENDIISPFAIIGDDNRTQVEYSTKYPYSAIVLLEIKWSLLSTGYATAFMISDNVAITSAHALYKKDKGWPLSIKAYPAKNGYGILNTPFGSSRVTAAGVCTQWQEYIDNSTSKNPTYIKEDWGAVVLKEPLGEETGTISIKCPTNSELTATINNQTVKICGYYNTSDYIADYHQYEINGNISNYSNDFIYYELDTYSGQSGSPILNEDNVAIGIHFGYNENYNCAVRMDENMIYYFNLAVEDYG